jgi:hypothetical protein
VGEGALKIGRRRQQSRRFFVMVGWSKWGVFLLALLMADDGSLSSRSKKMAVGYN